MTAFFIDLYFQKCNLERNVYIPCMYSRSVSGNTLALEKMTMQY